MLQNHAQANGPHGFFGGTTLFAWGVTTEAEALWWIVAGQGSNLSVEALGTLARFYQVRRDAIGQYKVFNQLHALHPKDDAVTNNFVFFAVLTSNREQLAEQLARDNADRHHVDVTYQATLAFVYLMRGKADQALRLIAPLMSEEEKSSAVLFVYGLALAGTGEKTKAREILHRLEPATLTVREVELINASLGD